MKKFNLMWSVLWGILSSIMLFTGFELVTGSAFGFEYSWIYFRIIEISFVISAIFWLGSIVFLFYDVISKKRKSYFVNRGSLTLYCLLNVIAGVGIGYLCLYILARFF